MTETCACMPEKQQAQATVQPATAVALPTVPHEWTNAKVVMSVEEHILLDI